MSNPLLRGYSLSIPTMKIVGKERDEEVRLLGLSVGLDGRSGCRLTAEE
jgi:hypothetical protein